MKLDSVIIYTHNLQKAVDFYQNRLNLSLDLAEETYASFRLEPGINLGIKQLEQKLSKTQTIVFECENVEHQASSLQSQGVELVKPVTLEPYGKEFTIRDPDNNKIEYLQRV